MHFGRLNAKNLSFFYFVQKIYLKFLFFIVFILVSVAFFTLLERKVLGYSHSRFGPNKNFYWGVFQPFRDAIKLFLKLDFKVRGVNFFYWLVSPVFGITLSVFLWGFPSFWGVALFFRFSFLLVILVGGFSVYFLLYRGWSTTTKYRLLGSYRSSAQSVSYEVLMIIVFLSIVFWWYSLNLFCGGIFSFNHSLFLLGFPIFVCWLFSCVAECNRSPFDFSEGESELVSGFNTEYGGGLFSLIFIAEYSSILFLSLITSMVFFNSVVFFIFSFLSIFYLWVRRSFPRLRYDLLIIIAWRGLMVYLLGVFLFSIFLFF